MTLQWLPDRAWVRGTSPRERCDTDNGLHDWVADTDGSRHLVSVAAMCRRCGLVHTGQVDLRAVPPVGNPLAARQVQDPRT